ncbi:amino acid permease [Aquimarina sp. MMG016]|uniref:APC family permease n=1 Tax=Aquimarina sp. MMG016 TaxID=2822690 RepID=UPI001B3A192D|nr:amino acid permease [Aquimarina sp. MMG016]MBQ4819598.1 amino acid permease [Aquimarina sp. MMG016]
MSNTGLKRSITFPKLLFYGLGTMVGGGFYALLGEVAGEAGWVTPLAFLFAGILALINAFTYGELSSRFPVSAGEVQYVKEAFKKKSISFVVGWVVIATGVVSAATLVVATIGFLQDVVVFPESLGIVLLVVIMGSISIWGIGESVWTVLIITFIEVGALIYVAFIASNNLQNISEVTSQFTTSSFDIFLLTGILSGAFLGFYAFIGFEDMANMAEEVKKAKRSLPKAMLGSVILTTLIYVIVSTFAILSVSPEELAKASTPLARVVEGAGNSSKAFLTAVSILTGINGALVQIIMASRVLYGMGKKSESLAVFSQVHSKTQTPIKATLMAVAIILVLALFFPLRGLAEATSGIILFLFALLNLALLKIKKTVPIVSEGTVTYPSWIAMLGLVICLGMLVFKLWTSII